MYSSNYTGINIQYPISELILNGKKTIETRTYPLPQKLIGTELLIIETPGKQGNFKARIVGKVVFESSFQYSSKEAFYRDAHLHFVDSDSPWRWTSKGKWGWKIRSVERFSKYMNAPENKGIIYTTNISV